MWYDHFVALPLYIAQKKALDIKADYHLGLNNSFSSVLLPIISVQNDQRRTSALTISKLFEPGSV